MKEKWKSSAQKFKDVKWLALMAIFLALRIIVSRFSIPVGINLTMSFSFALVALCGMLFGPCAGMLFAAMEDIIEFMLFPSNYGFFIGYTLSAMLGILCYSLFFYEQRVTVLKIILAKFLSSFFVNVCIGSLWTYILLGKSKAYLFYAGRSLVKNATLFPIEVAVIVVLFNVLIPMLSRRKLITSQSVPIPFK